MAHLVIKRNPTNVFKYDDTLNSGYTLALARIWRREQRAFIGTVLVLTALGITATAPKIRFADLRDLLKFGTHSAGVYSTELLLALVLSVTLLYSLTRLVHIGIAIALRIIEKVELAHHLFRPIDLDEEYPRYMHSQVMNRSNHLYNLLMVNDNFEQRVNWFAVNACPKILPAILRNRRAKDVEIVGMDEFRLAKDNTGGFGIGMYIAGVIVPVGVYILSINALSFYSFFSSLPLVFLSMIATLTPYLISYLSYKAAVIKVLSGKFPWEHGTGGNKDNGQLKSD